MRTLHRFVRIATGVSLAFAIGCSDAPQVTGPDGDLLTASINSGPGNNQQVEDHILVQGDDAPPLEALEARFWAVTGERQTFRIRYDVPEEQEDPSPDFFRLDLHQRTLVALPNGTPLSEGDSVEITVTIDTVRLLVELEPNGLTFDPDEPAELRLWYAKANPDLNGDGMVDSTDTNIEQTQLGLWFRPSAGADWERLDAGQNLLLKRFDIDVNHFSGYAISW